MIEQYKRKVKTEVDSSISKIVKGDGTINGLSKRMKSFEMLLKSLDDNLKKIGNEYLNKNSESKENIEKVRNVNATEIKRFISSMNK